MAKAKQTPPNYEQLKTELETILAGLQRDELSVDTALEHYKRGLELVQQLEKHLKTAENKVHELQAAFSKTAA